MKKIIKESILNNLYFIIPALIWFLLGGALLLIKTKDELFFPINHTHTPSLNILNDVFSAYGRGDVIAILLIWLLIIPIYRNRQYIITSLVFGISIPTIIYYTKYFGEKKAFINKMIDILKTKAKQEATKSSIDKSMCDIIYMIYYLSIFIIFMLLIVWIIYDIYRKNYYMLNSSFAKMLKTQLRLEDMPEFNQLKNVIYITDNFSFDITLVQFILTILFILYLAYFLYVKLNIEDVYIELNILLPLLLITIILGIIFFIYNFIKFSIKKVKKFIRFNI